MSRVTDIADAVVAELNAAAFTKPFTSVRGYQPTYDLKDMKDLHVTVVPKARSVSLASRAADLVEYSVDVGVQQKIANDGDVDGLMVFVEEIAAFLNRRRLTYADDVAWAQTVNEPIFSPEHLGQLRQFTSVLTVTYRAVEQ